MISNKLLNRFFFFKSILVVNLVKVINWSRGSNPSLCPLLVRDVGRAENPKDTIYIYLKPH